MIRNRFIKSITALALIVALILPLCSGLIHVGAYDYSTTQSILTSQNTTTNSNYGNSVFKWLDGKKPSGYTGNRSGKNVNEIYTPKQQSGSGLNRFAMWCVEQTNSNMPNNVSASSIQAANGYYTGGLHKGLAAILENGYPITTSIPMLNADGTTTSKSWSGEYARQITANAIRAFLANHNASGIYSEMKTTGTIAFDINTDEVSDAAGAMESLYYLVALAESAVTGGYSDGRGGTSSSTGIKYTAWGPTLNIANHTVTKSGNNYTGTITINHNNDVAVVSVTPSKGTVTNVTRVNGSKTTVTYTVPTSQLADAGEQITFDIVYKSAKLRVWHDGRLESYIAKFSGGKQTCLAEPWPASSQAWPNSDEPQSTKSVSFNVAPAPGTIIITLSSSNHAATDNNSFYSMDGIKYELLSGGSNGTGVEINNISGATYVSDGVFSVNGSAYNTASSNVTITISNIAPGSYYTIGSVDENDSYSVNRGAYFYLDAGEVQQFNWTLNPKYGSVEITKSSADQGMTGSNSDYSLAGAVYQLTNTTVNTTYTMPATSSFGTSTLDNLPFGIYQLQEVTASQGFNKSNGIYTFTLQDQGFPNRPSVSLTATDTDVLSEQPKTVQISITKSNANPTFSGNISLAGAVYSVYRQSDDKLVCTLTTAADGTASGLLPIADNASLGLYMVETTAPYGFILPPQNENRYDFTATAGNNVTLTSSDTGILSDTPNIGKLEINKTNATNPGASTPSLAGAVYAVQKSGSSTWTNLPATDANGYASIMLESGTYTIKEVTAPTGFFINNDTETVTISALQTTTLTGGTNSTILSDVEQFDITVYIQKIASDTNQPLSGAVLQVERENMIVERWTTDGNPHTITSGIGINITYTLRENSSPNFYNYAANINFTINASGEVLVGGVAQANNTITMTDPRDTRPVVVGVIKTNGNPAYTGNVSFAGTEYKIYNADTNVLVETIMLQNMSVNDPDYEWPFGFQSSDMPNEISLYYNASSNGILEFDNTVDYGYAEFALVPGNYYIVETIAPNGFAFPSPNRYDFSIDWSHHHKRIAQYLFIGSTIDVNEHIATNSVAQNEPTRGGGYGEDVYSILATFFNEQPIYHVYIDKKGADTYNAISGASLQIKQGNTVIESWTSNGTPHEIQATLTIDTVYTLHEVSAPDGYMIADDIYFKVNSSGTLYRCQQDGSYPIAQSDKTITMYDNPKIPIWIIKAAEDVEHYGTMSMAGAEFKIYNADTDALVVTVTTTNVTPNDPNYDTYLEGYKIYSYCDDGSGYYNENIILNPGDPGYSDMVYFYGYNYGYATTTLDYGNYYIVETKAPAGFKLPNPNRFDFSVSAYSSHALRDPIGNVGVEWRGSAGLFLVAGLNSSQTNNSSVNAPETRGGHLEKIPDEHTIPFLAEQVAHYYIDKKAVDTGLSQSGAVLQIKQGNTVIESWTSNGTPHEIQALLQHNVTYTLHEVSAPSGYYVADDINFYIGDDGKMREGAAGGNGSAISNGTLVMYDQPLNDVVIIKQSSVAGDTRSMAGAQFAVYDADTDALVTTVTTVAGPHPNLPNEIDITGTYGYATFSLKPGNYYMVETVAPAGFQLASPNRVDFTIHQQLPTGITSSNIMNYYWYISGLGTLDNSVSHGNGGEAYYTCYQRPFFIVSGTTTGMIVDDDYSIGFMDTHSVKPGEQVRGGSSYEIYYRFAYGMTTPFLSEEPVTDAYIEKLTGGGVALPGATLQIKQGNTVVESWTSTNSPHKINATLTPGTTYTLHEVSAPSGYGLALDINFTVDATGNILIGGQTQTNNSVKMYDYKKATMPASGSEKSIILFMTGLTIILLGGFVIWPRRKRDYGEQNKSLK